jgi:hypothetical protein
MTDEIPVFASVAAFIFGFAIGYLIMAIYIKGRK